jgi:hypothetical protein
MMSALAVHCRHLEDHGLDPAQSPARFLDWSKVKPEPAKLHRKRHHSAEVLQAAYARVGAQAVWDTFRLMACYGMHLTEVGRIASGMNADITAIAHPSIKDKVGFFHEKAKRLQIISVDAPAWAAVEAPPGRALGPERRRDAARPGGSCARHKERHCEDNASPLQFCHLGQGRRAPGAPRGARPRLGNHSGRDRAHEHEDHPGLLR